MELAVIFNAVVGLISTGNYFGLILLAMIIATYLMWKKLSKIELSQKPKHEKTDYNKFIEYDSLVMDELESIRKEHDADRAIILELRNGEFSIADVAALKCYVRNESLKPRTFSFRSITDGIPASFFSKILRTLIKGNPHIIEDVSELEETDYGLFHNLNYSNVKSMYCYPLVDMHDKLYGALIIHFCKSIKVLNEREIKAMTIDAQRVSGEVLAMKRVEASN